MSANYDVELQEIERLEKKLTTLGDEAERALDEAVREHGTKMTVEEITTLIPVGERGGPHAKQGRWEKVNKFRLGFDVKVSGGKRGFGYLVFPNEGRGKRNPVEQRFMQRGLEKSTERIYRKLNEELDKKIKGTLK